MAKKLPKELREIATLIHNFLERGDNVAMLVDENYTASDADANQSDITKLRDAVTRLNEAATSVAEAGEYTEQLWEQSR